MFSFISRNSPICPSAHLPKIMSCHCPQEPLGDPNLPHRWGRRGSAGAIHNARRAPPNPGDRPRDELQSQRLGVHFLWRRGNIYEIYDSNGIFIPWGTIFPKPDALLKITE